MNGLGIFAFRVSFAVPLFPENGLKYMKQECIQVGCVPAARWPYAGVCFLGGGVLSPGEGVPSPGGMYLVLGGT